MGLVVSITYIMAALVGLYILLVAYGILPSKSDRMNYRARRLMKLVGFVILIYSIVRLAQILL